MICFNCGYKLESNDIKECTLCGMKLPQKCNACDSLNPMMAKFCFNCGTQISNLNSQGLTLNSDRLSENRKNVAVIFADISGFTALSEQMDPEGVREIINDCFDYITRPVYELEGTIDKYIGDCVMILFGAKYSHYDDPKRAVLCAMKMQKLIRKYSQEHLSTKGIELGMSIGVNYGLVVTGKVGNYFDKDYTVMGDIVNTAQRLQTSANEGSILVSESVYLETIDAIKYSDERQINVKNKRNSVKCYSPIKIKNKNSTNSSIFIGREEELDILNSIYRDKANYRSITILGEPGIGKTNLLKNFLMHIDDKVKKIWIDCNISYRNRVYNAIANIIYGIIDTHYNDSNEVKSNRLKTFVSYLMDKDYSQDEIKRNFDFISLIIGLDRDNDFQSILDSMKYQDIKEEILTQLTIFFEVLLKKHETLIVVDGLHWADNSSIDIIKELINRNHGLRKNFIFTSRYELDTLDSLPEKFKYLLKLEKLQDANIQQLVCNLFNCSDIDHVMFDLTKQLTNGNPLYIIELINSIKRKKQYYIKDEVVYIDKSQIESIPDNIEKLILENLSEFNERTLEFLETASVIGKKFSLSWMKNLITDIEDVTEIVNVLIGRNIISLNTVQLTSGNVDKSYKFNEDLTREVIYKSILNKRKREIHKRIGEFIENSYQIELENYYDILSYHFEKAGLDNIARKYYYRSAIKYKNNFSITDALYFYERYIENVDFNDKSHLELEAIRALIDMAYIYTILTDHDNALNYLNKALKIATLSDDMYRIKIMIANIYKEQGLYRDALELLDEIGLKIKPTDNAYGKLLQLKCNILRITGNSEVLHLVEEAEQVLLQKKDFGNLSEAMNEAGILYFIKGDIDNSTYYLNKAYEYAEKVNNVKTMSKISGNLGIIYHASGFISKAIENINNAITFTKKISNLLDYITAINNLGIVYMEMGEFNKAEDLFRESASRANEKRLPHDECIALINLADVMFEKGSYEASISLNKASTQLAVKHNIPVEEGINYLSMAKLHLKNKEYEKVTDMLEKAYKNFKKADEISYICEYHRYMSIYELIHLKLEEAMLHCEKCIELAVEAESDHKKLKGLRLKGYILSEMGKYKEALNMLHESISLSYQSESNYELAKGYYQSFAVLYRQNLKQEAHTSLLKAQEAIQLTDKNQWTAIIEATFEDIKKDLFKYHFIDI